VRICWRCAATLTRLPPDAFSRTPQAEFNASVSGFNQAIPSLSEAEIIVGLARIAALAETRIPGSSSLSAQTGFRTYPMRLQWLGDGLVHQFRDIVAAFPHPNEPLMRHCAQLRRSRVQPDIDSWIPFDCA
jgi:hypothetical protein